MDEATRTAAGPGLGVDIAGLAKHMIAVSPTWHTNSIAEFALKVMMEKWGQWFASHWHAASFAVSLTACFIKLGGVVDDMAPRWDGRDFPADPSLLH